MKIARVIRLTKAATNPPPASNESSGPSESPAPNEPSASNEKSGFGKRITRRFSHIMNRIKRKDPRSGTAANEPAETEATETAPQTKKKKRKKRKNPKLTPQEKENVNAFKTLPFYNTKLPPVYTTISQSHGLKGKHAYNNLTKEEQENERYFEELPFHDTTFPSVYRTDWRGIASAH